MPILVIANIGGKFGDPFIYKDSLKKINKNYNIAWDNKTHSLISQTRFPIISSNDRFLQESFLQIKFHLLLKLKGVHINYFVIGRICF